MRAYASGAPGATPVPLAGADRIVAIGSDGMMAAVAAARHGVLALHMSPGQAAIGSINLPMRCMLKEICAPCLQPHVDSATGRRSYVFCCFNQDQPFDFVDFAGLDARLRQNNVQEEHNPQWLARVLRVTDSG